MPTQPLGQEDPLEVEMALQYSAQEIPWTEDPGGLQSIRVQKESDTNAWNKQHKITHMPCAFPS